MEAVGTNQKFSPDRRARVAPQTMAELRQLYPTAETCQVWAEGLERCPACDAKLWWRGSRRLWRCSGCGKDIPFGTLTAWDGSHVSLPQWFRIAWHLAGLQPVAVRQLQRLTGLALTSLHPVVRAVRAEMVTWAEGQVLGGNVEVDELLLSWNRKRGRGARPAVMLLAERPSLLLGAGGTEPGRVLAVNVKNTTARTCEEVVGKFVQPGAAVFTDAWAGYRSLDKLGYKHTVFNISGADERLGECLPLVQKATSELRRSFKVYRRHPTAQYFPLYSGEWSWR